MDANRTLLLLDSAWRDEQAEEHARITGCEETRGESTAVATCKGGLGAKEGGGGAQRLRWAKPDRFSHKIRSPLPYQSFSASFL